MEHFNKLTPAEAERLALLAEECGEVVQAVGKILRHGYASRHPDGGDSNRQLLQRELGDVAAAVKLMHLRGDVADATISGYRDLKLQKVKRYLHHQDTANTQE